ncbi:MAG TPA: hypothetical protein VNN76_07540 [Bacteroidota bacterium]|nr:hypothetical protein [Bacteroidota bacterium]
MIFCRNFFLDIETFAPSSYDITHNLAVVAKYSITAAFQVGWNFKYATGRPYTPFVGARYDSRFQIYEPLSASTNSARYPDYRRMDVRLTYLTQLFDRYFTVVFVETLNAFNTNNIFGYTYSEDYSERREIKSYFGRRMVVFGVQVTM